MVIAQNGFAVLIVLSSEMVAYSRITFRISLSNFIFQFCPFTKFKMGHIIFLQVMLSQVQSERSN